MRKIFVVVLFFILSISVSAEEITIDGEDFYNETVQEILTGNRELNPIAIINKIIQNVFGEIAEAKRLLKTILLTAVAAGLLKILSDSFGGESGEAARLVCLMMMTSAAVKVFAEAAGCGAEIIHTLCGFITKFEPIFIGLLASGGALCQAAAFQPMLTASVYVLSLLVDNCILPLAYFSAIVGIVSGINSRVELGNLNKLIQSVSKWLLTGVLTLFSAILAVYGFGANAMNTVALKGIKFAVGSFVPVVGGILSDTVDTVLSGTNLLKNAVGTAGMLAILSAAAVPIVKIWVMTMLLRVTAAVIEPFSEKSITNILTSAADSVGTVFSAVLTSVALFVISIGVILMSTGVSI